MLLQAFQSYHSGIVRQVQDDSLGIEAAKLDHILLRNLMDFSPAPAHHQLF